MFSPRQIVRELRGFAPFPAVIICWDQVGVSTEIDTPSTSRAGEDGRKSTRSVLSLWSSFAFQTECLPTYVGKGKSSQLGLSTDFVIHCVALLPLVIISQASRIWGHHSRSYTADPSLHLQPCLDDTSFPDRSFCSLHFTCMQLTTERGKWGKKKTFENIYHLLFFLSRMKISCTFVHVNAELSFCKSRWWQFLNTVIFCR